MGSFDSSVADILVSPDAEKTKLIEVDAKNISASRKEFFSSFTADMKVSRPSGNMKLGYGPPSMLARIEKFIEPGEITMMTDYKKDFRPLNFGGKVTLAQEDIDDAEHIGSTPKEMLSIAKGVLPKSRAKFLNYLGALVLVCGVKNNTPPPGVAAWLDPYCGDGLSLYNNAHTYKESDQTYSNLPDADLPADINSLQVHYQKYTAMKLMDGSPTDIYGETIVSCKSMLPDFEVLFQSQFDPESADNAINKAKWLIGKGSGATLGYNPWFPDTFWISMSRDMGDEFYPVQHVQYIGPKVTTDWQEGVRTRRYFMTDRMNMQAAMYGLATVSGWAAIPA